MSTSLRLLVPVLLLVQLTAAILHFPTIAAGVAIGACAIGLAAYFRGALPKLYLGLLAVALAGYAFLGRGFAYLGSPPVYVGELLLGLGALSILIAGGLVVALRSPLAWLLVAFMLVGARATVPYLESYGVTALRDAALWGYGLFALLVNALITKKYLLSRVVDWYTQMLRYFLLWVPIGVVLSRVAGDMIPRLPASDVPLVSLKSGDIAVHLAGALAFLVLGLDRSSRAGQRRALAEWLLWLLWFASFGLVFNNRGGIITVLITTTVLLLLHPAGRWGKHLAIGALLISMLIALDIEIPITQSRTLSVRTLTDSIQSVVGTTGDPGLDGTRSWRLTWWTDIVNYTVLGEYFWSGKGYGVNLADADGYQVTADHSLRSPHNAHLTVLARGGVPGALSWFILQGTFAAMLLRAIVDSRRRGQFAWAKVNIWILCYWLAFIVNGAFDVFLEGPQGGIWFWSIFGLGLAALQAQRLRKPIGGEPFRT